MGRIPDRGECARESISSAVALLAAGLGSIGGRKFVLAHLEQFRCGSSRAVYHIPKLSFY